MGVLTVAGTATFTVVGRLAADPDRVETSGETTVCRFRVGNNRSWTDRNNERREKVSFLEMTVFGGLAETCLKYLHSGDQVFTSGRLEQDRWEDPKTGDKRQKMQLVADEVTFGRKKGDRSPAEASADVPTSKAT